MQSVVSQSRLRSVSVAVSVVSRSVVASAKRRERNQKRRVLFWQRKKRGTGKLETPVVDHTLYVIYYTVYIYGPVKTSVRCVK